MSREGNPRAKKKESVTICSGGCVPASPVLRDHRQWSRLDCAPFREGPAVRKSFFDTGDGTAILHAPSVMLGRAITENTLLKW